MPPTTVRRLTNVEYDNTVRDLLGDPSRLAARTLPFDEDTNDVDDSSQSPTEVLVDGYHKLAHDYAVKLTKDAATVASLTRCDPVVTGDAACQRSFIEMFVARAFRRPFEPADSTDFTMVFARGQELGGDFASGVRAVVEVVLQSPEFLYRIEVVPPPAAAQPRVTRLTSFETATRLSYLLLGSLPDDLLMAVASRNELQTKAQVAAEARRLLTDPRARDAVRHFYRRFLRLNGDESLSHLAGAPNFTADLPELLLKETDAFIDEVTWQVPGDFKTLLTAPFSFMNGALARFYGVPNVTGDAFQKVALDSTRRAGVLTQGSVLASTSLSMSTNPSRRGLLVFGQFLCGEILPEPIEVVVIPPPPLPVATTRERFQQHVSDPSCSGCHQDFDPVGFAFEHYDPLGQWRDMENGVAIDATGEIFKTDARGKFNGAVELAQRLGTSRDAQDCYVKRWMTYGYARQEAPEDFCTRQALQDAFAQAKGNVRELLVALTQTDAFLYRAVK